MASEVRIIAKNAFFRNMCTLKNIMASEVHIIAKNAFLEICVP